MEYSRFPWYSIILGFSRPNSDDRLPEVPLSMFTELNQSSLDLHRFQFLITELAMGFSFVAAAKRRYEAQNLSSAKMAMAHAEQAYDAMQCNCRNVKMSEEEGEEITQRLHMLREKLNELNQRYPT